MDASSQPDYFRCSMRRFRFRCVPWKSSRRTSEQNRWSHPSTTRSHPRPGSSSTAAQHITHTHAQWHHHGPLFYPHIYYYPCTTASTFLLPSPYLVSRARLRGSWVPPVVHRAQRRSWSIHPVSCQRQRRSWNGGVDPVAYRLRALMEGHDGIVPLLRSVRVAVLLRVRRLDRYSVARLPHAIGARVGVEMVIARSPGVLAGPRA